MSVVFVEFIRGVLVGGELVRLGLVLRVAALLDFLGRGFLVACSFIARAGDRGSVFLEGLEKLLQLGRDSAG